MVKYDSDTTHCLDVALDGESDSGGSSNELYKLGIPGAFNINHEGSFPQDEENDSFIDLNSITQADLVGSDEELSTEGITEIYDAYLMPVKSTETIETDEQRPNPTEIRQYLLEREVIALGATIITSQKQNFFKTLMQKVVKNWVFSWALILFVTIIMVAVSLIQPWQNKSVYYSEVMSVFPTETPSQTKYYPLTFVPTQSIVSTQSIVPTQSFVLTQSFAPSRNDDMKYTRFFDRFKTVTSVNILRDSSSPQHRALRWLVYDDKRTMFSFDEALLQRYALVTMFFATGGGESVWKNDYNFLSDKDVCDWHIKLDEVTIAGVACTFSYLNSVTEVGLGKCF